jgi:hypothetical protein
MKPTTPHSIVMLGACAYGVCIAIASALADPPLPGITVWPLGTNTYQITITNGLSTTNYELYSTAVIGDMAYPWTLISIGTLGQTNWVVDGGPNFSGFYNVGVGTNWDGDLASNSADADPFNSSIGALTITIDSPADHSTFQ